MAQVTEAPWFRRAKRAAEILGLCLLSGVVGGALTRHGGKGNYDLTYADFVSILLTAISLLMTVLAVFLAVLGFVGWTTFEQKVHSKTEDILTAGFAKGGRIDNLIVQVINARTQGIMFDGVQTVTESLGDEEEMSTFVRRSDLEDC